MGRNRAKKGLTGNQATNRIQTYLLKIKKLEQYKNKLQKELKQKPTKYTINIDYDQDCQNCIEKIKEIRKDLKLEIRELEKNLKISRKNSKVFSKEKVIRK